MRPILSFGIYTGKDRNGKRTYRDLYLVMNVDGLLWIDAADGTPFTDLPRPADVDKAIADVKRQFPDAFR